ncbi:MAG: hypothetical protein ACLUEQ_04290 [Cloacibacillus evryensis]
MFSRVTEAVVAGKAMRGLEVVRAAAARADDDDDVEFLPRCSESASISCADISKPASCQLSSTMTVVLEQRMSRRMEARSGRRERGTPPARRRLAVGVRDEAAEAPRAFSAVLQECMPMTFAFCPASPGFRHAVVAPKPEPASMSVSGDVITSPVSMSCGGCMSVVAPETHAAAFRSLFGWSSAASFAWFLHDR